MALPDHAAGCYRGTGAVWWEVAAVLAVWRSRFGYSVRLGSLSRIFYDVQRGPLAEEQRLSALGRRGAAMGRRVEPKIFLRSSVQRDVDRGG